MTMYTLDYPSFVESKAINGEAMDIEDLCLVDWMPGDIAEHIFTSKSLREIVETDFQESQVWEPSGMPFHCQGLFQDRAEKALTQGELNAAFENYIYFMHNRTRFTLAIRSFQGVALLNQKEIDHIESPNKRELNSFEKEILAAAQSQGPKWDAFEMDKWIFKLRTDVQVLRKARQIFNYGICLSYIEDDHLDKPNIKENLPAASEIRDYSRARKWFKTSADMSRYLKDPQGELQDRIACYSQYSKATAKGQLDILKDILILAQLNGRDDLLDQWSAEYAKRQWTLDGRFYSQRFVNGWKHTKIYYESDHECSPGWHEDYEEANPLIIDVALGNPAMTGDQSYRILDFNGRLNIARHLGKHATVDPKELDAFRGHLLAYGIPEDYCEFEAVIEAAGIKK